MFDAGAAAVVNRVSRGVEQQLSPSGFMALALRWSGERVRLQLKWFRGTPAERKGFEGIHLMIICLNVFR